MTGRSRLAVARIGLAEEQLDEAMLAVGALRRAWPERAIEACAGQSPAGCALWLLSEDVEAARLARAASELAGGRTAPVSCACRLLSDDPPDGRADGWLLPIPFAAPVDALDTLDRWYEEEHTPMLLHCPAWLRVRRFAVEEVEGASWNRLLVHDVADPEVLGMPEVVASLQTERRRRLADLPWFLAGGRRPLRRC